MENQKPTFDEVCEFVPHINVWSMGDEVGMVMRPEKPPRDVDSFKIGKGSGTRESPYAYLTERDKEGYYEIIWLWMLYRSAIPAYIKVGDWLLKAELEGVRANGRTYTRLLPLKYSSL